MGRRGHLEGIVLMEVSENVIKFSANRKTFEQVVADSRVKVVKSSIALDSVQDGSSVSNYVLVRLPGRNLVANVAVGSYSHVHCHRLEYREGHGYTVDVEGVVRTVNVVLGIVAVTL